MWTAYHDGVARKLAPLRVEEGTPPGLLAPIIYIDLRRAMRARTLGEEFPDDVSGSVDVRWGASDDVGVAEGLGEPDHGVGQFGQRDF